MNINNLIFSALSEDISSGDITTNILISPKRICHAQIIVKQNSILCGINIAHKIFLQLNKNIQFKNLYNDGQKIKKDTIVATIKGNTRAVLTGERVALNFLSHLSGIASQTRTFVEAIQLYRVKILDTRKTTPCLRILEKYAVRCGGGYNHRSNLNEMVMIKDNHLAVCQPANSFLQIVSAIKRRTKKFIEIEVDNLFQFKKVLDTKPDIILLDNMNIDQIKKAVRIIKNLPRKQQPLLEVSGGITLKNIKQIAKTGIDRISIGALTHSVKASDFSLEIIK